MRDSKYSGGAVLFKLRKIYSTPTSPHLWRFQIGKMSFMRHIHGKDTIILSVYACSFRVKQVCFVVLMAMIFCSQLSSAASLGGEDLVSLLVCRSVKTTVVAPFLPITWLHPGVATYCPLNCVSATKILCFYFRACEEAFPRSACLGSQEIQNTCLQSILEEEELSSRKFRLN